MKSTIAAIVALVMSCTAAPQGNLAVALYPTGTTFEVPCDIHGSHTQTIISNELRTIYVISSDDSRETTISEIDLLDYLNGTDTDVTLPE